MRVDMPVSTENLTQKQIRDLTKLKELSIEFESFFMKEAVEAMRKTVPESGLMDGGNAEKIYRSMYDDQLSKSMAESGGTGLAKAIFSQMSNAYLNSASTGVEQVSRFKTEE
jgi:flagellar protein FlgJ